MITARRSLATLLMVLFAFNTAFAQDSKSLVPPTTSLTITASASQGRVRFTAPSHVVQIHLEIYSEAGEKLFDTVQAGNVLDYLTLDKAGEQLPDDAYLCVVTVKTISGKLSQKVGTLVMQEQQVSVRLRPAQLSAAQIQAVGPVEENSALTVMSAGDAPSATVIAHDGQNGQVTSTTGALTFRTGDLFSGKEQEGMRLTEEGNLGIGTVNPEARLDVNGMIRARGGFQFTDGSILNLSPKGKLSITSPEGQTMPVNQSPNAVAGTANRLPKFDTNGSSLLDSALYQDPNTGYIGWGTTTPAHPFTVRRNGGTLGVHSFGELYVDRDDRTRSASMILGTGGVLKWIFGMPYQDDGFQVFDLLASPAPGLSRFYVHPTNGNVGIGTNAPVAKLDVVGAINTSAQYNIANDRILSGSGNSVYLGRDSGNPSQNTGGQNTLLGDSAGNKNTTGSSNTFVGRGAGFNNTMGSNNIYIGGSAGFSNTTESNNILIGDSSAGAAGITNAIAIGYKANVTQSNSLVLGSINGINGATADTSVGIGTNAPAARLHVAGASSSVSTPIAIFQSSGSQMPLAFRFGATETARIRVDSQGNLAFITLNGTSKDIFFRAGDDSGTDMFIQSSSGNVGIGTTAPTAKLQVTSGNVYITNPNSLIITSPNGACWFITVNNAGALSTISVPCP